jgi:class 3 adenylate cyclase
MDHLGENAPPLSPESKFAVSVAQRGLGEIVNDYSSDPRAIDSELYLGSLICTPLRAKQRTVGVIALGNTDGKPYPASDLKLLNTIALQTAAAIENAMASQQILSREVERKALKLEAHQRLQQSERLEAALCEAERQKNLAESTLRNILPEKVAVELQTRGTVEPMYFEDVTIGFADFVGFTLSTEKLAAEEVVGLLHEYFTAFDRIMRRYGLEKLRTMGDGYMFVSGLPDRKPSHPVDAVLAALEMVETVRRMARPAENVDWQVRIGLHTGPVIAGVVGIHKFQFDIWGDPVNFASRMESSGAPNRVNLSERTYSRVKDFIRCTPRGPILTKDGREVEMFFADGVLRKLVDGNGVGTPPAFARRYRVYFNRDVCAFPDLRLTQSHEP